MNSSIDTLIVTAHPDDETIFFAGLIYSRPSSSIHVVCVTDGGADGKSRNRRHQFQEALSSLGVTGEMLDFEDIFEKRLNVDLIKKKLQSFEPNEVFTHGIFGEYGHPHHQDVSYAVHSRFTGSCKVHSPAYNVFPDFRIELSEAQWRNKFKILSEIYWDETRRFQGFIPCSWVEGFSSLKPEYVAKCYKSLIDQTPVQPEVQPFEPYLNEWIAYPPKRQF